MSEAMAPCPADSDLMKAWKSYQETDEAKNSKHWAMVIVPMIQANDPEAKRKSYGLMDIDRREGHVEGSLWAAFSAGFAAAGGKTRF
jgi:hypothetical protein